MVMSGNLLKFVSWTHHTSYSIRQLFIQHVQYFGQKFWLLFVNIAVCYWRDFSRMKINRGFNLLFKQIAFETLQKFCLERATGLASPGSSGFALEIWTWPPTVASNACCSVSSVGRDILILLEDGKLHCSYLLFWSSSVRHCCWASKSSSLSFTLQWTAMHSLFTYLAFPIYCLPPQEESINIVGLQWDLI